MFVDASAIIAILARESDSTSLAARLGRAPATFVSPIVLYESVLGLSRARNISLADAEAALDQFLVETGAEIVPLDAELARDAIEAFDRFGKGRHTAGLNMGDCFAYACAQRLQVAMLFKGNDFPHTDVIVA
jgi:ribonuclease VapC